MNRKYLITLVCGILTYSLSAQTLQQARSWYTEGKYEEAKPVFQRYVKSSPNNGNYNIWYGVCCLRTGEATQAIPYLEKAVKRRVAGGQLYLAQAYHEAYRFQDAVNTYEEYIADQKKRKRPTTEADSLLNISKVYLRMIKGVEEVCIIDSFVVDKAQFLESYKLSENVGKLYTYNEYFQTEGEHPGSVYETEIGNKLVYGETSPEGRTTLYSKDKMDNEWTKGHPLPETINHAGNINYPYIMSDGVTIYYATDGDGLGEYDIYVSRYSLNTDAYLTPDNIGMPFNSPYNDYMYAIDEYNNLGWFASDRFQPEGKVCIYVFIPNMTKRIYNYEAMDRDQLIRLAQIHSLQETWKDENEVTAAKQRLQLALQYKPETRRINDFELVIDDEHTYYMWEDFKSPQAKKLYQQYIQNQKAYKEQTDKLDNMREKYAQSSEKDKAQIAPAIIDLENRVQQMNKEQEQLEIKVRNTEKTSSKSK